MNRGSGVVCGIYIVVGSDSLSALVYGLTFVVEVATVAAANEWTVVNGVMDSFSLMVKGNPLCRSTDSISVPRGPSQA